MGQFRDALIRVVDQQAAKRGMSRDEFLRWLERTRCARGGNGARPRKGGDEARECYTSGGASLHPVESYT